MDDDHRGCARCGKPAGDLGFCEPCRKYIEALTWQPIRATMPAPDLSGAAARAQRAVLRLEQALAAVTNANVNRAAGNESTGTVQVDEGPRADGGSEDASTAPLEIVRFSSSAQERVTEVAQPSRDVARFEDVMRVAPHTDRPGVALPPRDLAPPEPVAPPEEPVAIEPVAPPAPESVARPEPAAAAPFWFELVPAVEPAATELPQAEVTQAEAPNSVPPPAPKPAAEPITTTVGREQPQRNWVLALFLLALVGLIVVLTGRSGRD